MPLTFAVFIAKTKICYNIANGYTYKGIWGG